MNYEIRITKQAFRDIKELNVKQRKKVRDILENVIAAHPFEGKKLIGDLSGNYSIRLNLKDRIVYSITKALFSNSKVCFLHRIVALYRIL